MELCTGHYMLIYILMSFYVIHVIGIEDEPLIVVTNKTNIIGGIFNAGEQLVKQLPFIGEWVARSYSAVRNVYLAYEILATGFFVGALGGALPCNISINTGVRCYGLNNTLGFEELLTDAFANTPFAVNFTQRIWDFFVHSIPVPVARAILSKESKLE